MRKYLEDKQKKWFYLLILALIAYTVKNIFVGADVDEGYGIMAGYRLVQGDRLLLEMWEPHQTSAIFTAMFIQPFVWITGGSPDFLNIWLRVVFFVVQGLLAYALYGTIVKCISGTGNLTAALMAAFFYASSPKGICVPEYSNLQVWFTTALTLCLMWYFCDASPGKGRGKFLLWGGVFLACDVLAYPSMVLLFPVCIGYMLWHCRKKNPGESKSVVIRECTLFTLPCVLGALLFIFYVLSYMTLEQIQRVLPFILGDGSHQTEVTDKLAIWLRDVETTAVLLIVGGMLAAILTMIHRRIVKTWEERTKFEVLFLFWFLIVQALFQTGYWLLGNDSVVCPQINYLFAPLLGLYCYFKSEKKDSAPVLMILLSGCGYLAVILLSNWGPGSLNVYMVTGLIGGILCLDTFFGEKHSQQGNKMVQKLLFVLIICNVFGYSYRMIGGDSMSSNILEVRGYNHDGFRKGILTNYMTAYRYNENQANWAEMVPNGSKLLYVGASQFAYMLGDCTVSIPSTISTPAYEENLLAYWEMNPERYPDVVAVESMYGEISVVQPDSFIMQWLQEDFQATEVIEYPYVTVYRR